MRQAAMIKSAGLLIIHRNTLLLVKQRNIGGERFLSIPKGLVSNGESILDAAIRETQEETGLKISGEHIKNGPFLISYFHNKKNRVFKQIFYYIVHISSNNGIVQPHDKKEVEWAEFVDLQYAEKHLAIQQLSVLNHVNKEYMCAQNIEWLRREGFLKREKHPTQQLFIYNYTDKCKKNAYWNECTLWCRGLILDSSYRIIAKPMKKFFEYNQLLPEFQNELRKKEFEIYEKIDGSFGILYWINHIPYIATKGSFVSPQAYHASLLLFNRYSELLEKLNTDYSYYFEIIYPQNAHVVNYGKLNDIILIGAYNNKTHTEVPVEELQYLSFKKANKILLKKTVQQLQEVDKENSEGFVLKYSSDIRVKVKFKSYKTMYKAASFCKSLD